MPTLDPPSDMFASVSTCSVQRASFFEAQLQWMAIMRTPKSTVLDEPEQRADTTPKLSEYSTMSASLTWHLHTAKRTARASPIAM